MAKAIRLRSENFESLLGVIDNTYKDYSPIPQKGEYVLVTDYSKNKKTRGKQRKFHIISVLHDYINHEIICKGIEIEVFTGDKND